MFTVILYYTSLYSSIIINNHTCFTYPMCLLFSLVFNPDRYIFASPRLPAIRWHKPLQMNEHVTTKTIHLLFLAENSNKQKSATPVNDPTHFLHKSCSNISHTYTANIVLHLYVFLGINICHFKPMLFSDISLWLLIPLWLELKLFQSTYPGTVICTNYWYHRLNSPMLGQICLWLQIDSLLRYPCHDWFFVISM